MGVRAQPDSCTKTPSERVQLTALFRARHLSPGPVAYGQVITIAISLALRRLAGRSSSIGRSSERARSSTQLDCYCVRAEFVCFSAFLSAASSAKLEIINSASLGWARLCCCSGLKVKLTSTFVQPPKARSTRIKGLHHWARTTL